METANYAAVNKQTKHLPRTPIMENPDRETSLKHGLFGIIGKVKALSI